MTDINLINSTYIVQATHTVEGYDCELEIEALDLGEAFDKVEREGVFAANDGRLLESAQ